MHHEFGQFGSDPWMLPVEKTKNGYKNDNKNKRKL